MSGRTRTISSATCSTRSRGRWCAFQPSSEVDERYEIERNPVLDQVVGGAAIALEREFDVLGRQRIAIMKFWVFAQRGLEGQAVFGTRPQLCQTRRHRLTQHRFDH